MVKFIEISDQVLLLEGILRLGILIVVLLKFLVQFLPLLVIVLTVIFVLLDSIDLLLGGIHSEGFFKGERIDFLEYSFECDETLLEDLVPMLLSKLCNDWY